MKRAVFALVCLVLLSTGAWAQDDVPNLHQCIASFTNFMKDFSAFSVQNQQALEAEKQAAGYPLTVNYIFYTELEQRTQRLILLTANVMDFYILYNKTTYCYGRDEKNFLFSRIDFIQKMLQRLLDIPYVVDTSASNADTVRLHDKQAFFEEQVRKLQAFITKSLPALKH